MSYLSPKPKFGPNSITFEYSSAAHLNCFTRLKRVLPSERMRLVKFSVFCLASTALSDFEQQFAHPLSVIKRYKELQEITELLHHCLALAENDFNIEKNCLETVFNNDYFWL